MESYRLPQGPVLLADYQQLVSSSPAQTIEHFSREFLRKNRELLAEYSNKWVADPFHHWSRQWEYPFVLREIEYFARETQRPALEILDAGSGITFFPFLVRQQISQSQLTCCDSDQSIQPVFTAIADRSDRTIDFFSVDLAATQFPANRFDVIYCISVLEHVNHYSQIVAEFHRLLRPGGMLIITLDISLDGCHEITIPGAQQLLRLLQDTFSPANCIHSVDLLSETWHTNNQLTTTHYFKQHAPHLLPWKYPWLSSIVAALRNGRLPRSMMKSLCFSCHSFIKQKSSTRLEQTCQP